MPATLQALFIEPPIAIARLGGSSVPQDAYSWGAEANPRAGADTALLPEWTLDVQTDASVAPRMPVSLQFRDGDLIRPVCPFFEIWALVGEPQSDPSTWQVQPLTPTLLQSQGASTSDLVLRLNAVNAKAARRRNDPSLRFGTFPPLEVRANQLSPVPVLGVSPPGTANPMIPAGRSIPIGTVRFMRSTPQPTAGSKPWANEVNVEILRFRFTPAAGLSYGPPAAAQARPIGQGQRTAIAVPPAQAFLNDSAGWFNEQTVGFDAPADTYDALSDSQGTGPSLGVVDDTCDARITITLTLASSQVLLAEAALFVAPPHFAPDRRPILSLADEVNDRAADARSRSLALTAQERDAWVEDLFERAFETVSLMNVDLWREVNAKQLKAAETKPALPADGLNDDRAMGARDKLRNQLYTVAPVVTNVDPLPLSRYARTRHRALADLVELTRFVRNNPGRLKNLIRAPFAVSIGERSEVAKALTSMQMPPFMRHSNALPLTLSAWQFDLLQAWAQAIETTPSPAAVLPAVMGLQAVASTAPADAVPAMSTPAAHRLERVLGRLNQRPSP